MRRIKQMLQLAIFTGLSLSAKYAVAQKRITVVIDPKKTFQTIDNIGASSAWNTEFVGKYWDTTERETMARWLFSREWDKDGNPLGIGLSSYRFNIGGGTTELGDSSRLKDEKRRVECFLNADGSYDWSKQSGYIWFVKKAKNYGTEKLIAFTNTPPVYFTNNGLGFKTVADYTSNLKADKYPAYAHFLSTVLQHFDKEGIRFDYVSPVNEPQWQWYNNDQEGSPWTNAEIALIATDLDSALTADKIDAKILLSEAGSLEYLYAHPGKAGQQIQMLYAKNGTYSVRHLKHLLNAVGGHSYYTDSQDVRSKVRMAVRDTAAYYETNYWQTEYSMLGDGYKEGKQGKIPALDCALFLGKVIHDDFVYGNAQAWQFWNSCEPGDPDFNTRYYLVALHPTDTTFRNGKVIQTKMLWALGNYSRFITPGMRRIDVQSSLSDENLIFSAFEDKKHIVLICVNSQEESVRMNAVFSSQKTKKGSKMYVTDATHNLSLVSDFSENGVWKILPKSITTIVYNR